MADFILLMHADAERVETLAMWDSYIARLRATGGFVGGSSIGGGVALRKGRPAAGPPSRLSGFIRVSAHDAAAAAGLVDGNPVYECGGTVEVRELTRE